MNNLKRKISIVAICNELKKYSISGEFIFNINDIELLYRSETVYNKMFLLSENKTCKIKILIVMRYKTYTKILSSKIFNNN